MLPMSYLMGPPNQLHMLYRGNHTYLSMCVRPIATGSVWPAMIYLILLPAQECAEDRPDSLGSHGPSVYVRR